MTDATVLWRRLDQPGHESARLSVRDGGATLAGTAVFAVHMPDYAHERKACRLDYVVTCDGAWRTVSARVAGWVGDEPVEIDVAVDAARRWRLNGRECPQVEGCLDVDLNFSPSTNLLPIRRLGLAVGQAAEVRAAWLRFPSFALEPLDQVYRRLDAGIYRYESGGGTFVRDLEVDAAGFVIRYPDFFVAE